MKVPFQSILCPVDTSETGNLAVPVAYHLAGANGIVHLMHVCEPPYLGNPLYGQYVQGYVPTPDEVAAGEERVTQKMHRLPPKDALERGIRTEYHLAHGVNVANCIEETAHELDVDVVVMGTHGRTGLGRILMGSVATDVVKKKGLPVVLVHQDLKED